MARAFRVCALILACVAGPCLPGCSGDPRPAGQAGVAEPDAVAEAGRSHMTGASGYPRDPAKAREMFEAAAQKGSGAGLLYLGLLAYADNDLKAACGLFAQSAARGHPGGLREYGECQLQGAGGLARDPRAAAHSFRASIANGGVQAYESLARLYGSGEGVPKDPEENRHGCCKSARRCVRTAEASVKISCLRKHLLDFYAGWA